MRQIGQVPCAPSAAFESIHAWTHRRWKFPPQPKEHQAISVGSLSMIES
jgi:hypothetical protein